MVEIEGVCLDVDANGLPNPVPCPPDADSLAGDGMFVHSSIYVGNNKPDGVAGLCAEDDRSQVKFLSGVLRSRLIELPIVRTLKMRSSSLSGVLRSRLMGVVVPCSEDEIEFPEWCLEEQVDGSYLIVPCPEDQWMIPMIPEIHFFLGSVTLTKRLTKKVLRSKKHLRKKTVKRRQLKQRRGTRRRRRPKQPLRTAKRHPQRKSAMIRKEQLSQAERCYEATNGAELLMAATPSAVDNQTNQNSAGFASVSGGSERSIDNVETASVRPEPLPLKLLRQGSVGLIAGSYLCCSGGGFAAVGVAASRKRV